MSLKPDPLPLVPAETARVARATFPRGNGVMLMQDALGTISTDEWFSDLFPVRGQPAEAPWRLALVSVVPFMENVTDRQAAEAVRRCLDWKYALSLELTDQGFDHRVLSEFCTRLVTPGAEARLFDALLELCKTRGGLKAGGRQRTDSTHILAAVRRLNRLECVGEALFHALNILAQVAPEWVHAHAKPVWVERYGRRVEDYRLPKSKEERLHDAEEIGADGWELLALVEAPDAPTWLRDLPAVQSVRRIWSEQYYEQGTGGHWRTDEDLPPAKEGQNSPDDVETRFAQKRQTCWVGYTRPFDPSLRRSRPPLDHPGGHDHRDRFG